MKQVVVQFDVDGVLADWTKAFTELANGLWGKGTCPELQETTTPQYTISNQFTPKHRYQDTWEALLNTPNWWCGLKTMVFGEYDRIAKLAQVVPVYFVTNRWHYLQPANLQTAWWLRLHGVPSASVICTEDKGEFAMMLKVTHSIENRHANAQDIDNYIGLDGGKSYLINRLHNQQPYCPDLRVDTVAQFLDVVEKEI